MKKILFVMCNLGCDGASKSLVNLLNEIPRENLKIDLMLFNKNDFFLSQIPKDVNIIYCDRTLSVLMKDIKQSVKGLLKNKMIKLLFWRIVYSLISLLSKDNAIISQIVWTKYSKYIEIIDKEYDVAIGYNDYWPTYFVAEKVKAKKKIGWNHNGYNGKIKKKKEIDKFYYEKLDNIITVSELAMKDMKKEFYSISNKIDYIENIISNNTINKNISNEEINNNIDEKYEYEIITNARLSKEKGYLIALPAIKKLIKEGYDIKWTIIGQGELKHVLEKEFRKDKIEERLDFIGTIPNPYIYMKRGDIYLQPSLTESYGIALVEAMMLCRPIIATKIPVFEQHITDNENGSLVEANWKSIYKGLKNLLDDKELRLKYTQSLTGFKVDDNQKVEKFLKIINN